MLLPTQTEDIMQPQELETLLKQLIDTWENEVVEFKQANNDYKTDEIGKYFSALSNEANLHNTDAAWLVFGVNNKTRKVVGSDYRANNENLHSLKRQIAQDTEPSVTLRDIYVLHHEKGRVVFFEIPPAPRGIPIAWKGHYYSRAGESLTSLGLEKQDLIRQQTLSLDWTAQTVPNASIDDLDELAIAKAREFFAQKYANRFTFEEIESWSVGTFLERARLTQHGQITRTAILLLGKPSSASLLSPNPAQITWKLVGQENAYEHFSPPFLLQTTELYNRIRNTQLRIALEGQLVPVEISKYDKKIILEALHNCIAHQDYSRNGRIIVTEKLDLLTFENEGQFFEGMPDDYIAGEKTPRRYRNPFLTQAMAELNMIDTMGYGIHRMYLGQVKRYLPLPDYDLHDSNAVKLTIYGNEVNPTYTQLLSQKTNLSLEDILALDRVQKHLPISDSAITRLRKAKLIEGRKPNLSISAIVAHATNKKVDYIRSRIQDDEYYAKIITDFIKKFGQVTRPEIDELLLDELNSNLSEEEKLRKIANLLTNLRRKRIIVNKGTRKNSIWELI